MSLFRQTYTEKSATDDIVLEHGVPVCGVQGEVITFTTNVITAVAPTPHTMYFRRTNGARNVNMYIPDFSAASVAGQNTIQFLDPLPASVRPDTDHNFLISLYDNGNIVLGRVVLGMAGSFECHLIPLANFTNPGNCGFPQQCLGWCKA